jgi:hypothetical protein
VAGGLGSEEPVHRAGLSVGERLLRNLQQPLWRRIAKEGDIHQRAGSEEVLVEGYRNHYNCERPHSALGYRTPAEFAVSCEPDGADEELRKELESVIALS